MSFYFSGRKLFKSWNIRSQKGKQYVHKRLHNCCIWKSNLNKNWYRYGSCLCENDRKGNDKHNYVSLSCLSSTLNASASTIIISLVNIIVFTVVHFIFLPFLNFCCYSLPWNMLTVVRHFNKIYCILLLLTYSVKTFSYSGTGWSRLLI